MLLGVLFEKVSRERVKITRKVESLGAINLSPILEVAVKNADYSLVSPHGIRNEVLSPRNVRTMKEPQIFEPQIFGELFPQFLVKSLWKTVEVSVVI